MVLAVAQVAVLFENQSQMLIPHKTKIQLQYEGVDFPPELAYFDEDLISKISDNLRRLGGSTSGLTFAATPEAAIPIPPFYFGAKS